MVVLPLKSQAAESFADSFPECQAKKRIRKAAALERVHAYKDEKTRKYKRQFEHGGKI